MCSEQRCERAKVTSEHGEASLSISDGDFLPEESMCGKDKCTDL